MNYPFACAGATLPCTYKGEQGDYCHEGFWHTNPMTAIGRCPNNCIKGRVFALPDATRVLCKPCHGTGGFCADCAQCHGLGWTPLTDGWEEHVTGVSLFKYGDGQWAGHIQLDYVHLGYAGGDFGKEYTYKAAFFAALYRTLEAKGCQFPAEVEDDILRSA